MKRLQSKMLLGLALAVALLGSVVLSGCGGGDDENETDKSAAMRGKQEKDD